MKIAVARGDSALFTMLQKFSSGNFPIDFEQDAEIMLLEKALLNCFINPLTAILQVNNGQLISENNAFQLLKNLYNEIMAVFPHYEKIIQFEQVVALCNKTAANTSSMLADRLAGRKTEVDTIVAPFLKKAALQNQRIWECCKPSTCLSKPLRRAVKKCDLISSIHVRNNYYFSDNPFYHYATCLSEVEV